MSWLTDLFKYGKNKDPAELEVTPIDQGNAGLWVSPHETNEQIIAGLKAKQADLYSQVLARMCINRIATEVSRVSPELLMPNSSAEFILKYPNKFQTGTQFLSQLATVLLTDTNAYLIPLYNRQGLVDGLWVGSSSNASVVEIAGRLWVKYDLNDGTPSKVVEYESCGHLKLMQYRSYLNGGGNEPFMKVGGMYESQLDHSLASQKIDAPQWVGKLNTSLANGAQAKKQQEQFKELNFLDNQSRLLLVDNRFESLEQIKKVFNLLNAKDIEELENIAFSYWGVSRNVLQNSYSEEEFYAFYQSRIEPILRQIGEVMTKVLFTQRQIKLGQGVNLLRLQFSSVRARIDVAFGAVDRGMIDLNTGLGIMGLPPLPGDEGKVRFKRGEYGRADEPNTANQEGKESEETGNEGDSTNSTD